MSKKMAAPGRKSKPEAEKPKPDTGEHPKPGAGKPKPAAGGPSTGSTKLAGEKPKVAADESEPDLTENLDGKSTLDETKSTCELLQDDGFQLKFIKFNPLTAGGTVLLVNKADFMSKPTGRLKHLLFDPVGTKDPAQLRKEREAGGWTFICDSRIYVEDDVTRVMVFGRRKL